MLLRAFLKENQNLQRTPSTDWAKMEPIVRELATARTKSEKDAWAVRYAAEPSGASQLVVDRLTIEGPLSTKVKRMLTVPLRERFEREPVAPAGLVKDAQNFLQSWVGHRAIGDATGVVDAAALRAQFVGIPALDVESGQGTIARRQWVRKLLTLYLVNDHSVVNSAGHGNPNHSGYAGLPEAPLNDGPFASIGDIVTPILNANDFYSIQAVTGEGLLMAVRFQHQPHDLIGLFWRQIGNRWIITGVYPAIG
jgi:hypothetical protein